MKNSIFVALFSAILILVIFASAKITVAQQQSNELEYSIQNIGSSIRLCFNRTFTKKEALAIKARLKNMTSLKVSLVRSDGLVILKRYIPWEVPLGEDVIGAYAEAIAEAVEMGGKVMKTNTVVCKPPSVLKRADTQFVSALLLCLNSDQY